MIITDHLFVDRSAPHRSTAGRYRLPMRTTIDWRAQICQFLSLAPESSDDVIMEALEDAAEKLEEADRLATEESHPYDLTPRYQVIHTVRCAVE